MNLDRALVVANGPSLNDLPNTLLEKYPTFGMNSIFKRDDFRPDWWCVCDDEPLIRAIHHVWDWPNKAVHVNLADRYIKRGWPTDGGFQFHMFEDYVPGFSYDRNWGLQFSTTTTMACYVAYRLGFREIILVGFDCTTGPWEDSNPHFYDKRMSSPNIRHNLSYGEVWDKEIISLQKHLNIPILNASTRTKSALQKVHWTKL